MRLGALTGGAVGRLAPWLSKIVSRTGGGIAGTASFVGVNAIAGGTATIAAGYATGSPVTPGLVLRGAIVGGTAPLLSGEAFFVGAFGSAEAFGLGQFDNLLSAQTGVFGVIGAEGDPLNH